MTSTPDNPGNVVPLTRAPVTAAELDQALDRLVAAKKDACDVLERAMAEVPRVPGVADLDAALGEDRARTARALMQQLRIMHDPAANAA